MREAADSLILVELGHSLSVGLLDAHEDEIFALEGANCVKLGQVHEYSAFAMHHYAVLRISEGVVGLAWGSI